MPESLRLPNLFTDHLVLQRDVPAAVWGRAAADAKVTISVAGQSAMAVADAAGKWKVRLKPMPAGGPHELMVSAGSETLRRNDVLVGDVWVASGQSNMEWPLVRSADGEKAVTEANHPRIRLFHVPCVTAREPAADLDAQWRVCSPDAAQGFSAVAYYFGREIQRQVGVPIGLINSSWGGMAAEAFTPHADLHEDADFTHFIESFKNFAPAVPHVDRGNRGESMGWANAAFDDANWAAMDLPRTWHSTGLNVDGSVWFRRTVDLPTDFVGQPLLLNLDVISDFDETYFNGQKVGAMGKETPNWWAIPRHYRIDPSLVKPGLNTIAVRIFNHWGEGGMIGAAKEMTIHPESDLSRAIPVAGQWKYQVEEALPHRVPGNTVPPTVLFNAMIAPLTQYAIRGAIWYQGESNASRAAQYRKLFPAMIRAWRREWGQGDFPFLFVQLANFTSKLDTPDGSPWAELREAQTRALSLPNTGQAVIIDIGDATDIHPKNKKDVGLRLANEAMNISYGKTAPRSPMFDSLKIKDGLATVTFKFAGKGLEWRGEELSGFTLAGEDRLFHPAIAAIEGDRVQLRSGLVTNPVAVRYGWSENPAGNLYNRAGLPVCPFRTDDWPAVTINAK